MSFFYYHYAEYHYAEYHYAEYHYAEYHYVDCHYANCYYTECHYVDCHYVESYYARRHGTILPLTKGYEIYLCKDENSTWLESTSQAYLKKGQIFVKL